MAFLPGYIKLYENGELSKRIKSLKECLSSCVICPRRCGVNRNQGVQGICRIGSSPVVSAAHPHFGEEPPLAGVSGSGVIFMTYCNMKCVYCQNFDISQEGDGEEVASEELSMMMVGLQKHGCHNINFVTPTHQVPQIAAALPKAIENGLRLPLVYNCGGYEEAGTIRLLDGIFDIYMPDFKYGDDETAFMLSFAPGYVESAKAAIIEMHRQVGDLVIDVSGIAQRGLIVRHLVLPGGLAGTGEVMRFLAKEVSKDTYVNIMDQYRPSYMAVDNPDLARPVTKEEFSEAIRLAKAAGLRRIEGE
ncbi:MAG: radical SAM protein [Deltaproteobacteria bacterium]|nr:radical SAM protein [Deltaproteobacteria bacterium]